MGALSAYTLVKNRVRQINSQSRLVEIETLSLQVTATDKTSGTVSVQRTTFAIE